MIRSPAMLAVATAFALVACSSRTIEATKAQPTPAQAAAPAAASVAGATPAAGPGTCQRE